MNYFFKYMIPDLLKYFHNDKQLLLEFIPQIIGINNEEELENLMKEDDKNNEENIKIK